jgi:hypothetical protein
MLAYERIQGFTLLGGSEILRPPGIQGSQGVQGPPGVQGKQGFQGPHGPPGASGLSAAYYNYNPNNTFFALKGEADVDQVSVPAGEYIGIVTATADPDGSESDDVVFRIGTSAPYYTWIYSMGPIAATDQVYLANAGPIRFLCHSYNNDTNSYIEATSMSAIQVNAVNPAFTSASAGHARLRVKKPLRANHVMP